MYKKIMKHAHEIKDQAQMIFNESDRIALEKHGLSTEVAFAQFQQMQDGVKKVNPLSPVTEKSGYLDVYYDDQISRFADTKYRDIESKNPSVFFVPAAGAASRMFKLLRDVVASEKVNLAEVRAFLPGPERPVLDNLWQAIVTKKIAMYSDLATKAVELDFDLASAIKTEDVVSVFKFILEDMGYSSKPKAVLPVHLYPNGDVRTPLEEHIRFLHELQGENIKLHLVISPEHTDLINNEFENILAKLAAEGIKVNVDFTTSIQHPSSDAIAYNTDTGLPLHDENGNLVIRKAGHGANLANLNPLAKEYSGIFLRNIDNIKPEEFTPLISDYKKAMRVIAFSLEKATFDFIHNLKYISSGNHLSDRWIENVIEEAAHFIKTDLMFDFDKSVLDGLAVEEKVSFLLAVLDRPISVVGYVPLAPGQKGGGGFVVEREMNINGREVTVCKATTVEGQELEGGQSNKHFQQATHFNPVDIYLTTKRYDGSAFDYTNYVDASRAMVDNKSLISGIKSKIWEHPGLWNGSMADAFQVSVHIPAETFAPIKGLVNTLDPEHTPR